MWTIENSNGTRESQTGVTTTKLGPRTNILTIDYVRRDHQGLFTCTAKNAAGNANYSALLTVNGNN